MKCMLTKVAKQHRNAFSVIEFTRW